MRIPDTIEREHILSALDEILGHGKQSIPKNRRSTKFDILFEGERFPPKYVICLANKYVDQVELSSGFGGGTQTNNFLRARDFEIVHKKSGTPWGFGIEPEDESKTFEEGAKQYKLHVSRERDSRVSKLVKDKRWRTHGFLRCDVCGFDFHRFYGTRGYGYIEAHHTIAVCDLKEGQRTRSQDIALVCSNCHRMLHKSRPWLSIEKLRKVIKMKSPAKLRK
jgi:hypothetical protein